LFVGFVIPGESAAILGGVAAQMRVFDKRRSRLDDAQDFLARRGGMPVLLGRWATVEKAIGRDGALIAVAVVLLALVVWKVREHRASSREPRSGHPDP
jgi:membrane-associated protein